jgi:hypothetical protein
MGNYQCEFLRGLAMVKSMRHDPLFTKSHAVPSVAGPEHDRMLSALDAVEPRSPAALVPSAPELSRA